MSIDAQTWVALLPVLRLVFASLEGFGAVAIIDYMKRLFFRLFGLKLPGEFALMMTFGVSLVLTSLGLIAEGYISPGDLSGEALLTTFVTVFTVAKVRYDMVRKQRARDSVKAFAKEMENRREALPMPQEANVIPPGD